MVWQLSCCAWSAVASARSWSYCVWLQLSFNTANTGVLCTNDVLCCHILPRCCRDIHNVFGYYYHLATAEGLLHRGTDVQLFGEHGDRPFVLSRAFFSGASFVYLHAA
jgi:hypothetical protein